MELTKVSMNLSHKSMANIQIISELINESNRTRVIASALEIAKVILSEVNSGKQLILRDNDGNEQEIKIVNV